MDSDPQKVQKADRRPQKYNGEAGRLAAAAGLQKGNIYEICGKSDRCHETV